MQNQFNIKQIPEYPEYFVSDTGDIFSFKQYSKTKSLITLKPFKTKKGYVRVKLSKEKEQRKLTNERRKNLLVHRVVYETFVGPIPEGMQIDHINHDKKDNRLENLRVVFPVENMWNRVKPTKGYYYDKSNKAFVVRLQRNNVKVVRKCFKTEEQAKEFVSNFRKQELESKNS